MGHLVSLSHLFYFRSFTLSFTLSPELEVKFHEFDSYLQGAVAPPTLITPQDILSQACCVRLMYREPRDSDPGNAEEDDEPPPLPIWATCGLTMVEHPFFFADLTAFDFILFSMVQESTVV